ncbi:MAG: ATP-binding protein [Sphingobacteriales bacterium]
MKKITLTLILLGLILGAQAQHKVNDSLRAKLSHVTDDSTRVAIMLLLAHNYYLSHPDSNIIMSQQAYVIAERDKFMPQQAGALNDMATAYASLGDYPKAIQLFYTSLRIAESTHDALGIVRILNNLGDTYTRQGDYRRALNYLLPADKQWRATSNKPTDAIGARLTPILLINIGEDYLNLGKIDSADYYLQRGYKEGKKFDDLINNIDRDFGEVEIARGHTDNALKYLSDAIRLSKAIEDQQMLSESYLSEAKLYHNNKRQDSAEYFAQKALDVASAGKFEQDVLNAGKVLYSYYDEDHNLPAAYKYFRLATAAKDSIYSQDRLKQQLNLDFEEKQRQQEIAAAQEQYRASVRMYALIAGLVVLLLLAIIFWRNSRQRKKANQLLQEQKEEIQTALGELKTTQNQLVQSAKMASLGELTAGIAHEIQNPLNFVNNFSEVNREMLEELKAESVKPKAERDVQVEIELIDNLIENETKISHHGKRADFIVKGMLQHSRISTGERQVTNVNMLADEFLKLSYHGLRAKDKSFNAELVTNFDDKLPKVNIVQQDIGRVLINLFGNAFYAVNQKAKISGNRYKPTVEVITVQQNGSILIKVKDNGTGIPENIREKIMQPFFTTKPTGEGTGLGLSLSYDIVVKGHGGKISVESKEGEGSEFTVTLLV